MEADFFDQPILNSPYDYPGRHWELDETGQPTQRISESRRLADFITPIPKPKKRGKDKDQRELVLDEGKGLSTEEQQYDASSNITRIRTLVDRWRDIPDPSQWNVTPETARLLQHWRHHKSHQPNEKSLARNNCTHSHRDSCCSPAQHAADGNGIRHQKSNPILQSNPMLLPAQVSIEILGLDNLDQSIEDRENRSANMNTSNKEKAAADNLLKLYT